MTPAFPVIHSVLAPSALLCEVAVEYEIGTLVECRFLHRELNDTYLLRSAETPFILRVYRAGWRSLAEIEWELELLLHLHRKGIPVSRPMPRKDGTCLRALEAPEGTRQAVLFTYARGELPSRTKEQSALYGRAAAAIHNASDDFRRGEPRVRPGRSQRSPLPSRFSLGLRHLLDEPLAAIRPLLEHRAEEWDALLRLADRLREALAALPAERLDWGVCHGDLHGGNAHVAADGTVMFFDFDCGGPGWRAYDLATFRWSMSFYQDDDRSWRPFLEGYRQQRCVPDLDLQAVPLFVALRHIWLMGGEAADAAYSGYGTVDDRYFDRTLGFLREWEERQLVARSS